MTLSHDANLKAKTIEALRQYRKTLVKVEALEQEEDSARRAVTEVLGDIERAIVEGCASSVRSARMVKSISFSAKRCAYSDMPSFSSQSAICCIAAPGGCNRYPNSPTDASLPALARML
jgi:hypothetical protein